MLSPSEALQRLAAQDPVDALQPPLLAIDLARASELSRPAAGRLARLVSELPSAVTVGVAPRGAAGERLEAAFDLRVDDAVALAAVREAVSQSPLASLALVQLLRSAEGLPTGAGLFAESVTYGLLQAGPEFADWLRRRGVASGPVPRGDVLRVERTAGRLVLTLARPERRNAFGVALRDAFCEVLAVARVDPSVHEVELRGDGPDFCSGGDLDEFGTAPDPATAHAIRMARSPARAIEACGDRAHARLHGACVGAGIEIPAFCARVSARPGSWFRLPEVGMGLIPGAGGCVSLPRRIGRQRTAWMAITGARVDAATALAWGLVDAVEPG